MVLTRTSDHYSTHHDPNLNPDPNPRPHLDPGTDEDVWSLVEAVRFCRVRQLLFPSAAGFHGVNPDPNPDPDPDPGPDPGPDPIPNPGAAALKLHFAWALNYAFAALDAPEVLYTKETTGRP